MLIGNTVSNSEQYGIGLHSSGFEIDKESNGNNTIYNNLFNNNNNLGMIINNWNITETQDITLLEDHTLAVMSGQIHKAQALANMQR